MTDYAFYNGIFTPYNACSIPLSDRSIFFGDAVYDVIIGRNGVPYQLDLHLARLLENADKIGLIDIPTREAIIDAISKLIDLSQADQFMLYVQLSGNETRRKHLRDDDGVNLLITICATDIPERLQSVRAMTMMDKRYGYCNLKTTNLLPAVFSMNDAYNSGAELAIFHKRGYVTECSSANISIIKDGQLITHPLDSAILPGISEKNLVRICNDLGIGHICRRFKKHELFLADAVLITSTTKFVKVCRSIDNVDLRCDAMELCEMIFDKMLADFVETT